LGDLGKEKIPRYSLWRVRRGGKSIKNAGFRIKHAGWLKKAGKNAQK